MFLGLQKTSPQDFALKLKQRSEMLRLSRSFFHKRGFVEVDVSMLSTTAPIDPYIDLVQAFCCGEAHYLHSSPEYGMKKLLAECSQDIYQISHVFRDNEKGSFHSPEFMMVEWYRMGISFENMFLETKAFIELFVGKQELDTLTYKEAFEQALNIDPFSTTTKDLLQLCKDLNIDLYSGAQTRENLLNLILSSAVEPHFNPNHITVLCDYPPHEAALAKTEKNEEGQEVAKRFEIFFKGLELANGYKELTDAKEQEKRLVQAQQKRSALNKLSYPIDKDFIQALKKGLPECCGVAVGFDRLMLLSEQQLLVNR